MATIAPELDFIMPVFVEVETIEPDVTDWSDEEGLIDYSHAIKRNPSLICSRKSSRQFPENNVLEEVIGREEFANTGGAEVRFQPANMILHEHPV